MVLAVLAGALLAASNGNTQALVPLFAVGVFIGFTLSQFGMVTHWRTQRTKGWMIRAVINGVGAGLTAATTIIELISKFTAGAWLIVLVIPGLVLLFNRVHRTYDRIGALLGIGQTPGPPAKHKSLVVVPVSSISRLTAAGISTALSIGDEVIAVTVYFADPEDGAADVWFRDRWESWNPNVPLITLRSAHRSDCQADRELPVRYRGEGQVPQAGGADPGGSAQEVLGLPAVQPARRDPGPGDQARHGQCSPLPPALPAGAVRAQQLR